MDILVLSNDLTERSVIQQVLEHNGHQITFVKNSNDVLKLITEILFRFVIIDATEQEESVHPLIQKIRSNSNFAGHTYILLLFAKGQNRELVTRLSAEADDYLTKLLTPQELKVRVAVGVRILSMGDTLAQAHDQLENLPMYDNLTGFMNRQAFYKVAQGELERARRTSEGVSIIALDIDNFKTINDEHGTSTGDDVLKVVAQIIREKSRPYDCIGRWAGNQFTITLPGIVSTDAEKIVRRILAGVKSSEISLTDGAALEVKLNAGIASAQNINAYAEMETFIQSAMQALKNSKQSDEDDISIIFV